MSDLALNLPQIAGSELLTFVLVLSRIGGLFAFAPGFSSSLIPMRVRAVLAGALALAIMPVVSAHVRLPEGAGAIGASIVKEILIGLALAFAIGILIAAIQAGASLLDTIVGFSFAQIVDPFTSVQAAAFGQLYLMFAVIVLLLTGGDQVMIVGFVDSYRIVPLDAYPHLATLSALAAHGFVDVFVLALELTAPVIVALFITDAGLGLIARAAPQMNVFMVGLPAKVGVAFAMVAASLPFFASQLETNLENSMLDALRMLGG